MHRLFALASAFAFSVSVFGLSSCSKDKPDTWDIREPVISSLNRGDTPIRSADLQNLPGSSQLKITANDDSVPSTAAKSTCRYGEQTVQHGLTLSSSSIVIRDLWPEEFWKTLSPEELKKSVCNFDFNLSNANGSSHAFKLENVRIIDFTIGADAVTPADAATKPATLTSQTLTTLAALHTLLPNEAVTAEPRDLSLLCETFSNSVSLNAPVADAGQLLKTLIEGPFTQSHDIDPRLKKSVQDCRLLRVDTSVKPTHFALTTSFPFAFRPPSLEIKQTSELRQPTETSWPHLLVFAVQLKNTSPVATAIRLPRDFGSVNLRLLGFATAAVHPGKTRPGDFFEGSKLISSPLDVSITGFSRRLGDGTSWIYEILPGATLTVSARLDVGSVCLFDRVAQGPIEQTAWAGLMYGFTRAFKFEQYQDWAATPDLKSSVVDLGLVKEAQMITDEPNSFAPSQGFLESIDMSGRVPDVRQRLDPPVIPAGISVRLCW